MSKYTSKDGEVLYPSYNLAKYWPSCNVVIIDVVLLRFDSIMTSTKNAVPKPRLLAVVVTLLPAHPVMQVVIFCNKLAMDKL